MGPRNNKRKDADADTSTAKRTKKEGEAEAAPAAKPPPKKRVATPSTGAMVQDFDHYLFRLLCVKAENNNFQVSKDEEPDLHAFLQFLKKEYKAFASSVKEGDESATSNVSSLTPKQVKVLQYLHVPLTSRGDEHWNRFYALLKEYHERHGHVLVPRLCETPGLGDWVTDQRRQYKSHRQGQPSQMTQDRIEKLEELGFAWSVRNRPEWEHRFSQLLEYKEKHGDCKVPQHYKDNKALGKWVAKQREQYKLMKKGQHSFLTPYRLEKLEKAGFVWQVRSSVDSDEAAPPAKGSAEAEAAKVPVEAVKQATV